MLHRADHGKGWDQKDPLVDVRYWQKAGRCQVTKVCYEREADISTLQLSAY